MAEVSPYRMVTGIEIPQSRYDELIRAEYRLNLLQNALEDMDDYESVKEIKRYFGIPKKTLGESINE